jgi:hypothetical protein
MTYDNLIKTVSTIVENPDIDKKGLSLTYTLPEKEFLVLNEKVYFVTHPYAAVFEPTSDEFEIILGGILVNVKKA